MKYIDKTTEQQNLLSINISNKSTFEILSLINNEDSSIHLSINKVIPQIELLTNTIVNKIKNNGRLFYIGCGTSGRIGVLDASECPPTFSTDPNLIKGIIAGGNKALYESVEGAEDNKEAGINAVIDNNIKKNDVIIGISANGEAPFVLSALEKAAQFEAITALITFNKIPPNSFIKHLISIITGPEIISGSTRLKAGTATKMILNMITTTTMIKLNKTYKNYMVDLKVSNKKLLNRGINIVHKISGLSLSQSRIMINKANGEIKTALVMNKLDCNYHKALQALKRVDGDLSKILD